jgi:hypothetical protein
MSETFLGANTVFHQQNAVRVDGNGANVLTLADNNALDVAEGTVSFRFEARPCRRCRGFIPATPSSTAATPSTCRSS